MNNDNDAIAACEQIVDDMPQRPGIRYGGDKAFYRPWTDYGSHAEAQPRSRPPKRFTASFFMNSVTRLDMRIALNRKTLTDGTPFGSATYSKEELVAEMGAAFLCATAGIDDPTIQNSAAYIHGWLKFLKADPKALVIAGAQAQKARRPLSLAGLESNRSRLPLNWRRRRPETNGEMSPSTFASGPGTNVQPVRSLLKGSE